MRPTLDRYLMELAIVASTRTTCIRKGVGCVLADERGRVLAIAYNGVAAGQPHCNEEKEEPVYHDDPRAVPNWHDRVWNFRGKKTTMMTNLPPHSKQCVGFDTVLPHACEGHGNPFGQPTSCEAVHAEQNAILQCKDPDLIRTAYVTTAPCRPCMKLLLNTGCQRIVYLEDHTESAEAGRVWEAAGRRWEKMD